MTNEQPRYLVWSPDWEGDEDAAKAFPNSVDADDAASDWLEINFANLDYPMEEEVPVFVRDRRTGQLYEGVVTALPQVVHVANVHAVDEES